MLLRYISISDNSNRDNMVNYSMRNIVCITIENIVCVFLLTPPRLYAFPLILVVERETFILYSYKLYLFDKFLNIDNKVLVSSRRYYEIYVSLWKAIISSGIIC